MKTLWQKFLRYDAWSAMVWYMLALVAYSFYALKLTGRDVWTAILVMSAAISLDYALHRLAHTGRDKFPKSGLITGLIVVILLPAGSGFFSALSAVIFAIISKHFILWERRHIFNPAAFGVLAAALAFNFPLGWRADGFFWLVIPLGLLVVWRVKKFWIPVAFLLLYLSYTFFQGSFASLSWRLVYLVPWFFVLFMLPEPITSPGGAQKQIVFGAIVAALFIGLTQIASVAELALPLALLCANLIRLFLKLPSSNPVPGNSV